jgi:hypothetical protein
MGKHQDVLTVARISLFVSQLNHRIYLRSRGRSRDELVPGRCYLISPSTSKSPLVFLSRTAACRPS